MSDQILEQFKTLGTEALALNLFDLASALSFAIFFSLILRFFYIRYGSGHTNRRHLADMFMLLTVCVTLVIFMIKSSLVLSLGLVGALSIVRFRTAIKQPEELAYLFFAIGIGLGLGAGYVEAVVLTMIITLPILYIKKKFIDRAETERNVLLSLKTPHKGENKLGLWIQSVEEFTKNSRLHRVDDSKSFLKATFMLDFKDMKQMENLRNKIIATDADTELVILDNNNPLIMN